MGTLLLGFFKSLWIPCCLGATDELAAWYFQSRFLAKRCGGDGDGDNEDKKQ